MDGFGSDFSAGGSGGKVDTGTIMEQVKVQIAVANAQELLQVNHWTQLLSQQDSPKLNSWKSGVNKYDNMYCRWYEKPGVMLHDDTVVDISPC